MLGTLEKEMDHFGSDKNLMILLDIQNKPHLMDNLLKARVLLVAKIQYECAIHAMTMESKAMTGMTFIVYKL